MVVTIKNSSSRVISNHNVLLLIKNFYSITTFNDSHFLLYFASNIIFCAFILYISLEFRRAILAYLCINSILYNFFSRRSTFNSGNSRVIYSSFFVIKIRAVYNFYVVKMQK